MFGLVVHSPGNANTCFGDRLLIKVQLRVLKPLNQSSPVSEDVVFTMGVGYQPLPKESDDTAHFDEHARSGHHPISFLKSQKIFLSLAVLLFFSVAVNVGLVIREAQFSLRNGHACTSTYGTDVLTRLKRQRRLTLKSQH